MKGIPAVIATRDDLDLLAHTAPAEARRFALHLQGTATRFADTQVYPDGYSAAGPDDAGYLPPIISATEDLATLARYGFADLEDLGRWVALLN